MINKTYLEILGQYKALSQTVDFMCASKSSILSFFDSGMFERVTVIGSGSSYHIGEAVAMSAGLRLGCPSTAFTGGDMMLHAERYKSFFSGRTLAIFLSRSGETSELRNVMTFLRSEFKDTSILAITCTKGSDISQNADLSLELPWAYDESVCQTRSVTNLYAAALLFIGIASQNSDIIYAYRQLADFGEEYLSKVEAVAQDANALEWRSVVLLSDGEGFGLTAEAALAFNEISLTPSLYKHLLDVRHGPIVLVDNSTLVIARLDTEHFSYQRDLIYDLVKRGATVIVVSDVPLPPIDGVFSSLIFGKKLDESVVNAIVLPVAQLLSYYRAIKLGKNPDRPEGLDAWIKL